MIVGSGGRKTSESRAEWNVKENSPATLGPPPGSVENQIPNGEPSRMERSSYVLPKGQYI